VQEGMSFFGIAIWLCYFSSASMKDKEQKRQKSSFPFEYNGYGHITGIIICELKGGNPYFLHFGQR
jgi:hypothetical protein